MRGRQTSRSFRWALGALLCTAATSGCGGGNTLTRKEATALFMAEQTGDDDLYSAITEGGINGDDAFFSLQSGCSGDVPDPVFIAVMDGLMKQSSDARKRFPQSDGETAASVCSFRLTAKGKGALADSTKWKDVGFRKLNSASQRDAALGATATLQILLRRAVKVTISGISQADGEAVALVNGTIEQRVPALERYYDYAPKAGDPYPMSKDRFLEQITNQWSFSTALRRYDDGWRVAPKEDQPGYSAAEEAEKERQKMLNRHSGL